MIEGAQRDAVTASAGRTLLDMNAYQWTVLFAAWLGWGFDIFDSLLFNYVAPNAVPVLLDIPLGTAAARAATLQWTGILTSLLLIGWAVGGIIFGRVADRLGRTRTLLLTMMMYAIGTAACAFAPNMATLVFFRIIASLGIGGEWAAGAAMVAEVVPEHRRVEAGALCTPPHRSVCSSPRLSPIKCRACTLPAALKWRGAMCSSLACYPRPWRSSCDCS